MAEMAIDAVAAAINECAAVRDFDIAAYHSHRHMAAQAEVADVGDILVGRGELGEEQRIAIVVGRQAAFPDCIGFCAGAGVSVAA